MYDPLREQLKRDNGFDAVCAGWRGHPDLSGTALFYAAHIAVNGMTDAPVVGAGTGRTACAAAN